ncbi:MAG: DNA replication and repair protein RecF [Verrucomicrobiota bacterium]
MLSRLKLRHFRCIDLLDCELGPGMTVFVGPNAQGKTSILEAACVLLRLQSPRTNSLREVIQFRQRSFAVEGEVGDSVLLFGYSGDRRRLKVDGGAVTRGADYLRYSGLVAWMANDDLELVRGGGEKRRRYLDFLGVQLDGGYRESLRRYDKALRSRNYLLKKDKTPSRESLDAYAKVMVAEGMVIMKQRAEMVTELGPLVQRAQIGIGGVDVELGMVYAASGGADLEAALDESREEETRRRQTLVGPHRDDVALTFDGMPASAFGSEGQQRTMALALKLAQAEVLEAQFGEWPLLLLDDIFGELDKGRRNALMAMLPVGAQKLVTTTHLDWLEDGAEAGMVHQVRKGAIC